MISYHVIFTPEGVQNALRVQKRVAHRNSVNMFTWGERVAGHAPNALLYSTTRLHTPTWLPAGKYLSDITRHQAPRAATRVATRLYACVLDCARCGVLYADAHPWNLMLRVERVARGAGGEGEGEGDEGGEGAVADAVLIDFKRAVACRTPHHDSGTLLSPARSVEQAGALLVGYAIACVADSLDRYFAAGIAHTDPEVCHAMQGAARDVYARVCKRHSAWLDHPVPATVHGATVRAHTCLQHAAVSMQLSDLVGSLLVGRVDKLREPQTHPQNSNIALPQRKACRSAGDARCMRSSRGCT